jgi:hypothetical protein
MSSKPLSPLVCVNLAAPSEAYSRCLKITIKLGAVAQPVIPAAQEAETRRITVQGQPRQKVLKTPSQSMTGRGGVRL